jgi:cytochrome P450
MTIPCASLWETLQVVFRILLPAALQGLFLRRPGWSGRLARRGSGKRVSLLVRLRRKYRAPLLKLRLPRPTYLVLGIQVRQDVLRYSPVVFDAAGGKRRGMTVFQPGAVTIALPADWPALRAVNDRAVGTPVARELAPGILERVRKLATADPFTAGREVGFREFDEMFETLSAEILFGRTSERISGLFETLRRMMREANSPLSRKTSRRYRGFAVELAEETRCAAPDSVLGVALGRSGLTWRDLFHQVPHWMFAMRDTLLMNVVQTFILLSQHPWSVSLIRDRVSGEVNAEGIQSAREIEWCVLEAMRLWPTTPILARRSLHDIPTAHTTVPRESELLIINEFNHRDPDLVLHPDEFHAERWEQPDPCWQFNPFGHGPQICPGRDLGLTIAGSLVATVFSNRDVSCLYPVLDLDGPLPSYIDTFSARFRISEIDAVTTSNSLRS